MFSVTAYTAANNWKWQLNSFASIFSVRCTSQYGKNEQVRNYLATRPEGRFVFVFTPTHGSWLNLIESFFSKMTKQMLRGIRVNSKEELANRIYLYFDEVNRDPVVYHWTYKMNEISVEEATV